MPLGLIWQQQIASGRRVEDIAAQWPEMTVEEIARIVEVATRRSRAAPNHDR